MKARVKATGEIIEISTFQDNDKLPTTYDENELEFLIPNDYWTNLRHQYAGIAMQGLLGSRNHYAELTPNQIALDVCKYATALVNRLKEEEK